MKRRTVLQFASLALAAPALAFGQKPLRIGFLGATSPNLYASRVEQLRAGLKELGYVEDGNLKLEFRWAEGKYERLPGLAAELVRAGVDIIVTHGTPGSFAALKATSSIPIVVGIVGDPVASGIVSSIARPDRNLTGLTYFSPELAAKRIELLKEALPKIRRCSVLANPDNPVNKPTFDAMGQAAAKLGLELQTLEARSADRLPEAFSAMSASRSEGLILIEDGILVAAAAQLAQLAAKSRIPVVGFTEIADAGGFMAYGVNIPAMFRRAAHYVDRLHKGAKPADLPIERATQFDLIVNMKAAKALGIRIPASLLVRADRVIE